MLYFTANDGVTGAELWRSGGEAGNTRIVRNIVPGGGSSVISSKAGVGDTLFFAADDRLTGTELWKTNGKPDGTVRVANINPGSASSFPNWLIEVGGILFFSAEAGDFDNELWYSGGEAKSTKRVADIWPGARPSFPNQLVNADGKLFFVASDPENGSELRVVELPLQVPTAPSILSVTPTADSTDVPPGSPVGFVYEPGSVGVNEDSLNLSINGGSVPVFVSASGDVIHYPVSAFPPGPVTARAEFTDLDGVLHSREWTFTVTEDPAPIPEFTIGDRTPLIKDGETFTFSWEGGTSPFLVQCATGTDAWIDLFTTNERTATVETLDGTAIYRVVDQAHTPKFYPITLHGEPSGSDGSGKGSVTVQGDELTFDFEFMNLSAGPGGAFLEILQPRGVSFVSLGELNLTPFLATTGNGTEGTLAGTVRVPFGTVPDDAIFVLRIPTPTAPGGEIFGTSIPKPVVQGTAGQEAVIVSHYRRNNGRVGGTLGNLPGSKRPASTSGRK